MISCIIRIRYFNLRIIGILFALSFSAELSTFQLPNRLTIMKKKNPDYLMVVQWLVFLPLLLPISMLTGAMEGIKKVFEQANQDIFEEKVMESVKIIESV